jgi:hypothetical protein
MMKGDHTPRLLCGERSPRYIKFLNRLLNGLIAHIETMNRVARSLHAAYACLLRKAKIRPCIPCYEFAADSRPIIAACSFQAIGILPINESRLRSGATCPFRIASIAAGPRRAKGRILLTYAT